MAFTKREGVTFLICFRKRRVPRRGEGGSLRKCGVLTMEETMQLNFFLFPIIIFSWCIVLLFVLITMKSSWMIVLVFFTYNYLDACLCRKVNWDGIIAPKREFIFGQVPASPILTEFQKFLTIIHIMIFLSHMTWTLTFFFFLFYVCLGCMFSLLCFCNLTFVLCPWNCQEYL